MKSPTPPNAATRVAQSLDATISWLFLGTKRLYRAMKHRRDIAVLADQNDYLLSDIGLTRDDLRSVIAQPFWCDPTESLARRVRASRRPTSAREPLSSGDNPNRLARQQLAHVCAVGLVASFIGFLGITAATAKAACKPALAISDVQFSAMQPPTLQRKWTALVTVDASRCAENSRGTFEIGFSRMKESAPEIDFRERFDWRAPSVKVEVDFWADEAVEQYWLHNIAPCLCRS